MLQPASFYVEKAPSAPLADALIFEVDDVRDVAGDLIRCYDVQVDVQRCVQARSTAGTSKLIR